ncbi:DUF3015 family protein [Granulosicoccus antarcticus]|uniref:DUF3015 domain-containing protein n=1 Tax=Granulosicoccus antarcticus IMCC3135 TaxID=1192854 RepID=A0A2Z2NMX7_9GAMM|nr:DUF3015 family protein [Granulosicoccus antarcticus]ASJ72583.1 hypothetical protein IMCC3135_12475 [Granulosicoccus antarcticus IMCC3135]
MIRKLPLLLLPLMMASSGASFASSGPGCGLGQQIFAGQTGLAAHVMAASTNSAYTQLFGLSFDSIGCDSETVITAEFQRNVFVANNYDNIARDAAQGGGEHLQSLAQLMQMQDQDAEHFYEVAQINYDSLFGDANADHAQWLTKLDSTLSADPTLAKYSLNTSAS